MANDQAINEYIEYFESDQYQIDKAEKEAFIKEMGIDPETKDAWFHAECEFLKRKGWGSVGYKCVYKIKDDPDMAMEDPDNDEMMGWKLSPYTGRVYKWDDAIIIAHEVSNAEEELDYIKKNLRRGLPTVVNELIEDGGYKLEHDDLIITEAIWDKELLDDRPAIAIHIDEENPALYRLHCPPRPTEWHDLDELQKESPYWKKKLNHD